MRLRAVLVTVAALGAIGLIGYPVTMSHNSVPMVNQIVAAGYPIEELSVQSCTAKKCEDKPVNATDEDLTELTYRPARSPADCTYKFLRIGPGLTHKSSWKFQLYADHVDGVSPRLGSASSHIMGIGEGWTNDKSGNRWIAVQAPSPKQLWAFALAHLEAPDSACKPTGA